MLLICLGFTSYFAYHTIYGRHGLEARNALISRSELLQFEIASLEAVRASLSNDISLLDRTTPDRDLVDEIARDVLGFAHRDDIIFLVP